MTTFNEETAKKLQDKYNISDTTINVWRFRGEIPPKYFKDNFIYVKKTKQLTDSEAREAEILLKIIKNEKLNLLSLISIFELPNLYEILRNRTKFNSNTLLLTKKAIANIKIDLKKLLQIIDSNREQEIKEFYKIFESLPLKKSIFFDRNHSIVKKYEWDYKIGQKVRDVDFIKSCLLVILTELSY